MYTTIAAAAIALTLLYLVARRRTTLRWGILGCGDVTEKKSGPKAFNYHGRSAVTAVMRRDGHKAKAYAARHGVATHTADADALVASGVDALYIAAPPGAHLSLALKAAAAGKPTIVEKPMARNLAESILMADAFAKAAVPLYVAYYRRAYTRFLRLKALLDAATVGKLVQVAYSFRAPPKDAGWRVDATHSGGGLFVDVGSHALDLLDFVVGPLARVGGRAHGPGHGAVETKVSAAFGFEGAHATEARGSASWDFEAEAHEDLLLITGEAGTIRLPQLMNGDTIEVRVSPEGGRGTASAPPELTTYVDPPPAVVQRPFVSTALDAIERGDSTRCPSTAASALRTAAAMDAILEGYYGGRADAFWDRPQSWPGGA